MTPQDLRRARDGAFDRDYVRPTSGYGDHSFWTFSYLSYALVRTHSQGSPASIAIILQSRHDLEVQSLISRMQRLSACAQGAKRSDSKASMNAFGWFHQEGGPWQCVAVSRSASGSKHVQGRSASESGHAMSTLDRRARVEHHSASRGGIACHAARGECSASGGSFFCACRARMLSF